MSPGLVLLGERHCTQRLPLTQVSGDVLLNGSQLMTLRFQWDQVSIYISGSVSKMDVIIKRLMKEETHKKAPEKDFKSFIRPISESTIA